MLQKDISTITKQQHRTRQRKPLVDMQVWMFSAERLPWYRFHSRYTETPRSKRSYSVASPRYTAYLWTQRQLMVCYIWQETVADQNRAHIRTDWSVDYGVAFSRISTFFNLFCFSSSCCCVRHSPMRVTGQLFLHSWRHFLGLHLSWLTMAILVFFSAMVVGRATGSSTWGAERPGYRDQC